MASETSYSQARANLKSLLDRVADTLEPVIIRRRGGDDVALVSARELRSLMETARLVRSPNNAARLLKALAKAQKGTQKPKSIEQLRRELGIGDAT